MTDETKSGEANIWNPRTLLSVSSDSKRVEETQTAIDGQTLFSLNFSYAPNTGSLAVYKNGIFQKIGFDWNEQSDTSFFLSAPAVEGDFITAVGLTAITGDVGGGPVGDYLPLSGGTMFPGSAIRWDEITPGSSGMEMTFLALLGYDQFTIKPQDNLNGEIGFSVAATNGAILGYNTDGRRSLALGGRVSTYADLLDDDVITKLDNKNAIVLSSTYEHDSDLATFGSMFARFGTTTLGGVPGGQALIITNDKTGIYSGLQIESGSVSDGKFLMDMGAGIFYSERQQDNGANQPPLDGMVSRRWVENFGPGGVPEAPNDGQEYVRKNLAWQVNTGGSGVPEAPEDGVPYARQDATWVPVPSGGTVNWGDIGGLLSNQVDLQNALDLKANDANVVHTAGNETVSGVKTFTSGIVVSGQVSSIAVNCTGGGVAALGFNANNNRIQQVGTPTATTDAPNKAYVDNRTPGWALDKASGGFASNGATQGTQRNCSPVRTALGKYRITLTTPLTSINNANPHFEAFGSLVGIDYVYSVISTTVIDLSATRTDTGAAIDVGTTFSIKDRGLA